MKVKTRKKTAKKNIKLKKAISAKVLAVRKKKATVKIRKKVLVKKKLRPKKNVKKRTQKLTDKNVKIDTKKIIKKTERVALKKEAVDALFKARIKVVGIGGGGGSIVSEIGKYLNKASFVIADTDIRALKKRTGIKHFWFGKEFTHGLGTGVNPEIAREAAESEEEKIAELFKDQDIVILIASLGGGLGSGATQIFAQAAKSFGGITLGIFTLPFKFEGKNKLRIAQKALKDLKGALNVSITIPNERIFKIINSDTSITEAFSTVNKNLIKSLESLIDLIYNPGLINIDFADLRTILNGNGNFAFLNTVYSSGKNRAEDTVKRIFANPLYQNNNFIAEKILFNICGGVDLNMFEVEKISRYIAELNPKAKIIFGISKNIKMKNKIKTTILMTGPGKEAEKAKKIEAPKIEKVVLKKSSLTAKKLSSNKKAIKKIPNNNFVPILNKNQPAIEIPEKLNTNEPIKVQVKKNIRRNALEIKKAEAIERDKRLLQEEEWEVPAFLRRVKPGLK